MLRQSKTITDHYVVCVIPRRAKLKLAEMIPSRDIWLNVVSAVIGAMIAVLLLTFCNMLDNQGVKSRKNCKEPEEHDERLC